MKAGGVDIEMPPLSYPHLFDWLMEAGPADQTGMGATAIGWATIAGWTALTGLRLQPWEARLLRRLSVDWVAERHRAEKEDCPAPWGEEQWAAQMRQALENRLDAIFDR